MEEATKTGPVVLKITADTSDAEAAMDRIEAKLDRLIEKARALKELGPLLTAE